MDNTKVINYKVEQAFLNELFEKVGMYPEDAAWYAQSLTMADLRGVQSHGILRAPNYVARMECKAINPTPKLKVEQPAPAVTVIDADAAAGPIGAKAGMMAAIENAKKCGVGVAAVYNSNHFGTCAQYSQMAVDQGMIGIATTNVPTLIAAPGAKSKVVGNNPISIGIPTFGEHPFMLDMSLSVVAEGKLRFAAAKGTRIPLGWAADSEGNPTDDPETALKGFLLPIGGFKGLGLAYAMDILCGVLTDGVYANKIKSMYRNPDLPGETSHFFLAINTAAFVDEETMRERMADYRAYLQSVPVAEGAFPLCFPGEIEHNTELRRMEEGIPVANTTLDLLKGLKEKYGVNAELV